MIASDGCFGLRLAVSVLLPLTDYGESDVNLLYRPLDPAPLRLQPGGRIARFCDRFSGFRPLDARSRQPEPGITPLACRPVVKFDAFLKKLLRGAEIFFQIRKSRRSARIGCEFPRFGAIGAPVETPYNLYPFLRRG